MPKPKSKPKLPKLTPKQKAFVREYVECKNLAEATRRAGYNIGGKGGSKDKTHEEWTAHAIGAENIQKPPIAEALIKREMSMEEAFDELAREAVGVQVAIIRDEETKKSLKNQVADGFIDRAGYKAKERTENTLKLDLNNLSYDELVELTNKTKQNDDE